RRTVPPRPVRPDRTTTVPPPRPPRAPRRATRRSDRERPVRRPRSRPRPLPVVPGGVALGQLGHPAPRLRDVRVDRRAAGPPALGPGLLGPAGGRRPAGDRPRPGRARPGAGLRHGGGRRRRPTGP